MLKRYFFLCLCDILLVGCSSDNDLVIDNYNGSESTFPKLESFFFSPRIIYIL